MMKNNLNFLILLLVSGRMLAQCPQNAGTDDVLSIPVSIHLLPSHLSFELCQTVTLHNNVTFVMDNDFNLGSNQTCWLDFGDGSPLMQVAEGASVSHTYGLNISGTDVFFPMKAIVKEQGFNDIHSPVKELALKTTYSVNNAGFTPPDEIWTITTSATFQPPVQGAFPLGSPYNGNAVSGAHAYLKFAPEHNGKLLKPLIFVDGLDFDPTVYTYAGQIIRHGSTGWDVFMLGNDASRPNLYDTIPSVYRNYPTGISTFLNEGYDVIFLDFASGADWIEKNGLVLVELIKRVNARKAADATTQQPACDNAVVGASMGGQVAKWALSYMEEQGQNHQTHTYVSFDSPHRGAHIPLGIQGFAYLLHLTGQDANNLWDGLNAPAPRQMLIATLGGLWEASAGDIGISIEQYDACFLDPYVGDVPVEFDYEQSLAIRQNFQTGVEGFGYPQNPRNVAISCGTHTGEKLPFANGATYFAASRYENPPNIACGLMGNVASVAMAAIQGGTLDVGDMLGFCAPNGLPSAGCFTAEIPPANYCLFRGFFPNGFTNIAGIQAPQRFRLLTVIDGGTLSALDNASGCRRGDLLLIQQLLADNGFTVPVNAGYTSFMPTLSLLDIQWPMDDEHLVMDFDPNDPAFIAQTPFDATYAPDENLRHIELTPAMVTWTLGQLAIGLAESNAGLNLTAGQTFNYGKRKNRVPNTVINTGAKLAVNMEGRINYMTPNDPIADKPHFEVFTGGGCSLGKTVTVENGGTLQIGDPTSAKTGVFHALEASVVHVKTGGILHIANTSTLKIYSGARLILDPGAIVHLESAESKIFIEGDLVLNGDIDFQGYGYFEFGSGNKLEFGPGVANFRLEGRGIGNRFVRLSANLDVEAGHGVLWSHGKMEAIYSTLIINAGGSCRFNFMEVVGSGPANDITVIAADNANLLTFDYCDFNQIGTGLSSKNSGLHRFYQSHFTDMNHAVLAEGGSGFFLITDCLFENYPYHEAVFISNRPSLNITNSTWEGGISSTGLDLQQVTQVVMRSSNLNGHASMPGAVNLDGVSYFIMRNSGMSDNEVGINTTTSYLGGTSGIGFEPSNVFMLEGSFIQNGEAGINMLGDATVGLVLMDCSSLLNNDVGIDGTDVILMIDAINAQQHPLDGNEPNSFLRNGWHANTDQYFDICYDQKSPGQPIPMRKNWWAVSDIDTRQLDPEDFMDIRHNNCSVITSVDVSQALDRAPTDCIPDEFAGPTYPGAGTEAECSVSVSGEVSALGEAWHSAYQQVRLENFEAAEAGFQPIADLWNADLSSYSANCRQYIQVARAIVDGAGQGSAPRSKDQANKEHPAVSLNPNPSAGLVNIALPETICKVRIWDAYGKLAHETSAANFYRLEVSGWPSGLYWVDVSTSDGKLREYLKMVVQR